MRLPAIGVSTPRSHALGSHAIYSALGKKNVSSSTESGSKKLMMRRRSTAKNDHATSANGTMNQGDCFTPQARPR